MKVLFILLVGASLGCIIFAMAPRQLSVESLRASAIQALSAGTPAPAPMAALPSITPPAAPNGQMATDKQNPLNQRVYNRVDYSHRYVH